MSRSLPPHIRAFQLELRDTFRGPMKQALERGIELQMPRDEIAVSIVAATLRCAALAIVGGKLDASAFDGSLRDAVDAIRAGLQARATLQ